MTRTARNGGEPPLRQTVVAERRLVARLGRELRPYWAKIVGLLLLSMLATPLALLTPVPLKIVIDSVLGSQPAPLLDAIVPTDSKAALLVAASLLVVLIALLTHLQELATAVMRAFVGEWRT